MNIKKHFIYLKKIKKITVVLFILIFINSIFGQVSSVTDEPVKTEVKTEKQAGNAEEIEDLIISENNTSETSELEVETNYFKILFKSEGANITSFQHKEADYPRKDKAELAAQPFPFELYPSRNPEKLRNFVSEIESLMNDFLLIAKDISTKQKDLHQKLQNLKQVSSSQLTDTLTDLDKELEGLPEQKGDAQNILSSLRKNVRLFISEAKVIQQQMILLTAETKKRFINANYNLSKTEKEDEILVKAELNVYAILKEKKYPIKFIKEFKFNKDIHYWEFSWRVENLSKQALKISHFFFRPIVEIGPASKTMSAREQYSFLNFYFSDDSFESTPLFSKGGSSSSMFSCDWGGGGTEMQSIQNHIDFFGSSSRFMVMALQPLEKTAGLFIIPYGLKEKKDSDINTGWEMQLQTRNLNIPASSISSQNYLVYSGPKVKEFTKITPVQIKKYTYLKSLHGELNKVFNFGWTAPIRDMIVALLEVLYKIVPNYGVGIIIFALLFKLVFYPLNEKQAKSMKKMQALQPLMKEINDKYKDKPQEKQRKTMELYKKHKVNPLGGCLPMLIQLPIFIALYTAFSDSYELWRSPFIPGWIDDLSEPDTVLIIKSLPLIGTFSLNILPLVMGFSQFYQTKITMVSGDANQKKIMQFMPLILLFFFWTMPAGVVLYWTINNLLSIAQQVYTNKKKDEDNK
ncbi:MAG: membrane protein insertase YidC [Spirochaetia bacterium]|nr:membrane protein insertase YidC [Spirochaetia bacterium]